MTQYNDLYARDNFSDTGVIPSTGDLYQSPDIIPFQDKVLTWDQASSTYSGPDIAKAIINGGINNIYVRARNLNSVAGAGTVNLYYTDYSLNLCQTSKWVQLQGAGKVKSLSFVDVSGKTSIAPTGIAISNPSFLLTGLPPNRHICMIGVVQTTAHPVIIPPSFASNADFSRWVQMNPAVAWRNISYSANVLTQLSRIMGFGNVNPNAADFVIIITGRGFVAGTPVEAQCTDATCPIDVTMPLPLPDSQGNQIISFVKSGIPANFWGELVLTATSKGGKFPSGATLTVSYYQIPAKSNALDNAVARRFVTASGATADSAFTTAMLIKLGECTITISDKPQQAE